LLRITTTLRDDDALLAEIIDAREFALDQLMMNTGIASPSLPCAVEGTRRDGMAVYSYLIAAD